MALTHTEAVDYSNLNFEHLNIGDIIIHEEEIKTRTKELAGEIAEKYRGKNLLMVCLLKGAVIFTTDMMRALHSAGLDDVDIDFMKVSSYGEGEGTSSSGKIKIDMDMSVDPRGRNILLVDDVADTLHTFAGVAEHMKPKEVGSFATLCLLEKPSRHETVFPLDYVGFKIPDIWAEGYGMDTKQHGRCCPHVVKGPTKRMV